MRHFSSARKVLYMKSYGNDITKRYLYSREIRIFLFFLPLLLLLNLESLPKVTAQEDAFVVICPIDGDILDGISVLVERVVTEDAVGATALLFIIDTYGGRVDSAMDIANVILETPVPTIAFVTGRGAISAGALIAYSCDHIVMAPGVNIGASTPISPGVEMTEEMNEKSMSFLRAKYRALGEENGHNPLIGEAMVDASIELYGAEDNEGAYRVYKVEKGRVVESYATTSTSVPAHEAPAKGVLIQYMQSETTETLRKIEEAVRSLTGPVESQESSPLEVPAEEEPDAPDVLSQPISIEGLPDTARLISPAGKLLTLTTREAREIGLIQHSADTPEAALAQLGYKSLPIVTVEMTWAEALFAFLTSPMVSGLLLLCGIGGIYLEIKTPGFGLPGIAGGICLAIYFGSRLVIGLADWIDVLLVLVGLALLVAEIFFIPGFGVAGISGIMCLAVGIYLSLTRVTIPEYSWDFMRLRDAGVTIILASLLFIVFIAFTWKLFPRTRLGRGLVLAHTESATAGYSVQTEADNRTALGLKGKATSMLRPAGRGRFGTVTYDIMTRGEFIDAGRPIEIIEVEGNRYVVQEIEEETQN